MTMKKKFILFGVLLILACSKEFISSDYYPMEKEFTWTFTGSISQIKVTEEDKVASGRNLTVTFFDSLKNKSWEEGYIERDQRLYWHTFKPASPLLPTITFDPALPITPISEKRGEKEIVEATETRYDSTTTTSRIRVEYEVEDIGDIEVPAGKFRSLRLKMTILYLDDDVQPLLAGTSYWWYARGIGPVKYLTPSAEGELEGAMLGNRQIPQDD